MKLGLSADWHLRPRHLGNPARGKDFFEAAKKVVTGCIDQKVSCLLLGGDNFDESFPPSVVVDQMIELDELARRHGLPIYSIEGNHDHASPNWIFTLFGDRYEHEANPAGFIDINHKTINHKGLKIAGLGACSSEDLISSVGRHQADIYLWHGSLAEWVDFPFEESPYPSLKELDLKGVKALLCGDLHKRKFLYHDDCLVGYPGSTELVKRNDPFDHSFEVIHVPESGRCGNTKIPIETRPAFGFNIGSEEHLETVIRELQGRPKDPWPMVFVRHLPGIPAVQERLQAVLGDAALLRVAEEKSIDPMALGLVFAKVIDNGMTPEDFCGQLFVAGSEDLALAQSLCRADVDHNKIISEFIDSNL